MSESEPAASRLPFTPCSPSLSLCTVTNSAPESARAFLRAWRPHVQEIVIAVDVRADARTPAACAELADVVHVVPPAPYAERYHGWLHAQCSGEWALRIDDDELPSDALLRALPELLASREHTHFYLPCRWLYGGPDRYLASPPWNGDLHPRLVRAAGGLVRAAGRVHREPEVLGPYRIVEAPFLHLTTLIDDVHQRRERADRYERRGSAHRSEAGDPVSVMYLPEDRPDASTAELPAGDAERVRTFLREIDASGSAPVSARRRPTVTREDIEAFLHQMPSPPPDHRADIRVLRPVPPLLAGSVATLDVEVRNAGASAWPPGRGGWPQLRVGSRWSSEEGVPLPDRGPRAFFSERVVPGATTRLIVPVIPPERPGIYRLEVEVLEEFVRWLGRPATQTVTVIPQRPGPIPVVMASTSAGSSNRLRGRLRLRHRRGPRATFVRDLRRLNDTLAVTAFADRYWVWGGLLLGWARQRAPILHDLGDADFAFLAGDPAFPAACAALTAAGFEPYLRFRNNVGTPTEWTFVRHGAKFEFWALTPEDERLIYYLYSDGGPEHGPPTQARASLEAQPRTSFSFLGRTWQRHADHDQELTAVYGEWRRPDDSWWYMNDRAIVAREPWYRTGREWDGRFGDTEDEPCMA